MPISSVASVSVPGVNRTNLTVPDPAEPVTIAASPYQVPALGAVVLVPVAGSILDADARLAGKLDDAKLRRIVDLVPDPWLTDLPPYPDPEAHRQAYLRWFRSRLETPRAWVEEAEAARREASGG